LTVYLTFVTHVAVAGKLWLLQIKTYWK